VPKTRYKEDCINYAELVELHCIKTRSILSSLLNQLSPRSESIISNNTAVIIQFTRFYCEARQKVHNNLSKLQFIRPPAKTEIISFSIPLKLKPLLKRIETILLSSFLSTARVQTLHYEYYIHAISTLSNIIPKEISADVKELAAPLKPEVLFLGAPVFSFESGLSNLIYFGQLFNRYFSVCSVDQKSSRNDSIYISLNKTILVLCGRAKRDELSMGQSVLVKHMERTASSTINHIISGPSSWKMLVSLLEPALSSGSTDDILPRGSLISTAPLPKIGETITDDKVNDAEDVSYVEIAGEIIHGVIDRLNDHVNTRRRRRAVTTKELGIIKTQSHIRLLIENFIANGMLGSY
jgi:hypothetical protein